MPWLVVAALCVGTPAPGAQLLFAGDISLSRQVAREIAARPEVSPWHDLAPLLQAADWRMGNLEGSVGTPQDCAGADTSLCFTIATDHLRTLAAAPFDAVTVENNHASDAGPNSRGLTRAALASVGVRAFAWDTSPTFVRVGAVTLAHVALSTVAAQDGGAVAIPSPALQQKLRLARALADWVVVHVHWGAELTDWPQPTQRAQARWLVEAGADLIIGHHPHVVQAPECVQGKPVFYSLGNHLFDQKYPASKEGLLASCRATPQQLTCSGIATHTPFNSAFPQRGASGSPLCRAAVRPPLVARGQRLRLRLAPGEVAADSLALQGGGAAGPTWSTPARPLRAVEVAHWAGPPGESTLFTLEQHPSSLDAETGPRPYVYEVTEHGLVARWRGSALAWPLLDAHLLHSPGGDTLCALHRADSFLLLDPSATATRTAVYAWNGFGFSGVEDPALAARCAAAYDAVALEARQRRSRR